MKIILFHWLIISIESIYSLYKKDGVYSFSDTKGSILTNIVGYVKNIFIYSIYLPFIIIFLSKIFHYGLSTEINILSIILCLIIMDFFYYLHHRALHYFDFLWMLHHVHHSSRKFNLSVGLRLSWFTEFYLFIFFIPVLMIGFSPYLILFSLLIIGTYQFYVHDPYIKLPKVLDLLFVTPNNHRIHHDQEVKNQSGNFGGILSIWDRILGTYIDKIDTFTPGIKEYHQENFFLMQIDPIISYFKKWK